MHVHGSCIDKNLASSFYGDYHGDSPEGHHAPLLYAYIHWNALRMNRASVVHMCDHRGDRERNIAPLLFAISFNKCEKYSDVSFQGRQTGIIGTAWQDIAWDTSALQ